MAAMVIVNNPGDWGTVYGPLLHAPWHGITPTDLIFPFFLFIVGVSIPLAQRSSASVAAIARRALIIFALGMLLALYPRFDFATVRIPGVLQRIAVCYLAVALWHRQAGRTFRSGIVPTLLVSAILLLAYWALIFRDLTPEGNLGAAIDRAVFGPHLWRQSRTWDPEGLLSTLPAIATTLTGLAAGYVLTAPWEFRDKVRALVPGAVVALAIGYAWSLVFPLNKSLWTSSYVLVTSGYAALLLVALEAAGRRFSSGFSRIAHPFMILGRNALLLFVVSGLLAKTLSWLKISPGLYRDWFAPLASPKNASLLYAFANLAVLFALLWWLHRRRWYFRV